MASVHVYLFTPRYSRSSRAKSTDYMTLTIGFRVIMAIYIYIYKVEKLQIIFLNYFCQNMASYDKLERVCKNWRLGIFRNRCSAGYKPGVYLTFTTGVKIWKTAAHMVLNLRQYMCIMNREGDFPEQKHTVRTLFESENDLIWFN